MALYYLKENDGTKEPIAPSVGSRPGSLFPFLIVAFCTMIFLAGFIQLLGLTWPLEGRLLQKIPSSILPKLPPKPALRLLELPSTNESVSSLDVAMALRGLGKLHPARIMIPGKVPLDQESATLLPGVLHTLSAEGIDVIQTREISTDTAYHSVPLCRYDPPTWIRPPLNLESIPGKISNKEEGCFLPMATDPPKGIQLFAQTGNGEVIGSVWWELLQKIIWEDEDNSMHHDLPIWLLAGSLLVAPGHTPIFLAQGGMVPILETGPSKLQSVILEDFLLDIEQKERGEKSVDFDTAWNDAFVIIGTSSDRLLVGTLQQLESRLSWRCLSWINQFCLTLGCIFLLLIGVRGARITALILALVTAGATLAAVIFSLNHGILIPWLAPVLLSLGLLIRGMAPK